ncbi:MAG: S41 family peptidase [Rickettsiaceae bacterium]|nr:S41 family peptidase [Rickettsiaceae bacterium]
MTEIINNSKITQLLKVLILATLISSAQCIYADTSENPNQKYYDKFKLVFETLQKDYVTDPNKQQLIDYAIEGMLSSLDPHSSYFADEELQSFVSATKGEFGGIGIEMVYDSNAIKVITPIDDLPSFKAGIQTGDYIIKVNDDLISNIGFNKAVHELRGEPGTKVKITVVREGESGPLEFELTREIVKINSVKSSLDNDIAYIRIVSFTERATEEVQKALNNLATESKNNIKGIILDVRNNPGGLLAQAIKICDYFLDNGGIIVSTKGRDASSEIIHRAKIGTHKAIKVPMIVLINEGSASASEIVAAALHDNQRALLLGTKTYGKGSVQTMFNLDARSACKFTTALYYTPQGISIQAEGVHPDILIEPAKVEYSKKNESKYLLSESSFKNHIKQPNPNNDQKKKSDKENNSTNPQNKNPKEKLNENSKAMPRSAKYLEDFQYARAYDLLQGMIISGRAK